MFIDRMSHLRIDRKPDESGGGPGAGGPPEPSSRSRGMSRYWDKVRAYQGTQPGMNVRDARGSADFRRLYGRYREAREELPRHHAEDTPDSWRKFAEDYRTLLEELGVEDSEESRRIDWGS